ncbi:hypothetical protein C8R41DRAFT_923707 [Lentinula lateritia]|uniref:Ndc10 domain-containing protein n=1 Tax=Lentinula lateritia TaxID=40482 RepID=A0ABQ8V580_9AGAR|nr:hypothetical protein C8R41DRAFT_923707 [Lentinula lateritia]
MQASNSKKDNYSRHVSCYVSFIEVERERRSQEHPNRKSNLTAEPITVAKVALFLNFETTRPKTKGGTGTVGAESISQAISALENHRFNHQHEKIYKNCPESQKKLREDSRISAFEKFARRNEHLCALNAEKMKTSGPLSATYTPAQLRKLAISSLQPTHNTPTSMSRSLRDRAVILLCAAMAFRGDSVRSLQLSDLGVEDMPLPAIAPGVTVKILTAIRDNAKHNKEGRPETHAALRHLYPEMCCIGGLAFYFFDFDDPDAGELGRREWWQYLVFPGNKGPVRLRTNALYAMNDIHVSSVTHGGRHYVPKTAGDNRASLEGRKALGKWKEGCGAFENAYDHQHPLDGMLGVAMFDVQRPDSYTCARNCLQPPPTLLASLFPWVEEEQQALAERRQLCGKRAEDYSLDQFLSLLLYLRVVLLQNAALIYVEHPDSHIFKYTPFDSMIFRDWAQTAKTTVEVAETEAREAFKNIPTNLVSSLRGVLVTERIESERRHELLRQELLSVVCTTSKTKNRPQKRKRESVSIIGEAIPLSANTNSPNFRTLGAASLSYPLLGPAPSSLSALQHHPTLTSIVQPTSTAASFAPLNPGVLIQPNSPNDDLNSNEQRSWTELIQRYGEAKLHKHKPWEWNSERKEHLPSYRYQKPSTLCEYWEELTIGLNGYISIQELNNRWEARWRRNISGLKTNKCRSRDNWTINLVWRFLDDQFPIPTEEVPHLKTTRSFITYIQKKDSSGMNDVLTAANSYP